MTQAQCEIWILTLGNSGHCLRLQSVFVFTLFLHSSSIQAKFTGISSSFSPMKCSHLTESFIYLTCPTPVDINTNFGITSANICAFCLVAV